MFSSIRADTPSPHPWAYLAATVSLALAACGGGDNDQPAARRFEQPKAASAAAASIDVMTQNQYLGADLAPVLAAATATPFDPAAFSAAVVAALRDIAAARPAERIQALAAEIAQRNPDVVGLQEAYKFACTPFPGVPPLPGKGCDDPSIRPAFTDQLANTEAALGGRYLVAGKVTNNNFVAIPFAIDGVPALLAVADRDAILVRSGLPASAVNFAAIGACVKPSDQGCNYRFAPPPLATPLGSIALERGFLAVDVEVKGSAYRVFNTHLEIRQLVPSQPQTRLLQVGQAYELVATALGTQNAASKLIIVGDINSDPRDTIPVPPFPPVLPGTTLPVVPPYQVFVSSGFTDAWTLQPNAGDGFTCCQAADLANPQSRLSERIDMVFTFTRPTRVLDMRVLGDTFGDKTLPRGDARLWPSDHSALAARLLFR